MTDYVKVCLDGARNLSHTPADSPTDKQTMNILLQLAFLRMALEELNHRVNGATIKLGRSPL